MVDLAPGEGPLAAADRAGVVDLAEGVALVAVVEPLSATVEHHRLLAVEDGRDDLGLASEPLDVGRGELDAVVEPPDAELLHVVGDAAYEVVELDPHQQGRRVAAAGELPAGGGEVLDELAQGVAPLLQRTREPAVPVGRGLVGDLLAEGALGLAAWGGHLVEGPGEEVPVHLGDREAARPGAVAVVAEHEVGVALGVLGLPAEHDRLVLVGQVVVDPVVHPSSGLTQPLGVHRLAVAATVAGGLAEDELLGLGDLQRGGAGGGLLGGVDDDADLSLRDSAGGEGVAGRVVLLLQQPGDP
jgi:hypothetical protein